MIHYVTGDILKTQAEALAHGVAPNDDFKQGLALSLREQWPSLYKDFRHYCHTTHPKEGGVWAWKGAGGPVVLNLLTQEHPQSSSDHPGKATETYVNHALKNMKEAIEENNIKSVAITKVATGVGGLDWEKQVKPLIEKQLGELDIPVFVYETYKKGEQANEQ